MSQRDEVYAALQKADAAGDTAGAKQLADYIRTMPADQPVQTSAPENTANSVSRIHDVGTGFNSGLAGLAGLPVDTVLNVWDLAKAGVGSIQGLATGKTPSSIFDPADRSKYIGSSAQLRNLMNKSSVTDTQLSHPEDAASRYLHVGTSAIPGAMTANPTTGGQIASALASNVIPSLAAQGTAEAMKGTQYENTAPILASLLAQGAPNAISSTAKWLTPKPDESTANAANILENAGITLDASQKTGGLKSLKKLVQDNPFTSGAEFEKAQTQKQQFTQAALKLMGEDAPAATANVMDNAQKRIGGTMEAIAERTPIKYTPQIHADLTDVLDQASRTLDTGDLARLQKQVDHLQTGASSTPNGVLIDGQRIKGTRSELGLISKDGGSVGHFAGALREVLDDATQQNAKGSDYQKLVEARQQYRIMKQIEPVIDRQGDGMISPARLPNSMARGNAGKNQTVYGRGDQRLVELAQAGSKLLPDRFANSGTPARAMIQAIPTAAAAAAGHFFLGGNPLPAIGMATGTYGIPKLAQALLNSKTALTGKSGLSNARQLQYATTQASQLTPEQRRQLTQALGVQ